MNCEHDRGEPPTVHQWVKARKVWRAFWPCGCRAEFDAPQDMAHPLRIDVAPPDESKHGNGQNDPYTIAIQEWCFGGQTFH